MFTFNLPRELIAQSPARPRDHSRLMAIDRRSGSLSHHIFRGLPSLLSPSDVLVFNNSLVIPARLYGHKNTGGKVEILLLRRKNDSEWEFISHPGLRPGQVIDFSDNFQAEILHPGVLKFINHTSNLINRFGRVPLPPYIRPHTSQSVLRRQYQTVYADTRLPGSSAAPTAGLHFTHRLLGRLNQSGIQLEYVTLHVGLGTFKTPTPDQVRDRRLHREYFTLSPETADRLNQAKKSGRRIIAVGTTSCRVLESCAGSGSRLSPRSGDTDIFILPGYKFRFIDGLITNFHLPGSSLIMLVSAFSSWPVVRKAYAEAIRLKYRFYSFGDACLFT